MAYRDISQGFAFVYVDVKSLLEKNQDIPPQTFDPDHGFIHPILNFNPDTDQEVNTQELSKWETAHPEEHVGPRHYEKRNEPESLGLSEDLDNKNPEVAEIKNNLDRLQTLHHKLHTILDDLNAAAKRKKKK